MNYLNKQFLQQHCQEILDFYTPRVVDIKGGYFQNYYDDGSLFAQGEKQLVSSTRIIVNYALAAIIFKNDDYLTIAKHGLDFLETVHWQEDTKNYAWTLTDNKPNDMTQQAYGYAFVLLAYAAVKKAGIINSDEKLLETFELLEQSSLNLKLNVVVQSGFNTDEINDFVGLTKDKNIAVRFIEEMPFNGGYKENLEMYSARDIHADLKAHFSDLEKLPSEHGDTASLLSVKGYKGNIGVIAAFSRTFCNTCNRLRISSKGVIKSCLYDDGVFNIRDFMRSGVSDEQLADKFREIVRLKPKDGFEAEKMRKSPKEAMQSMSSIGG